MNELYMDLTIAIGESGLSWRGKYSASFVASTDLDPADKHALESVTGYGETPLEAAANLLAMAAKRTEKAL